MTNGDDTDFYRKKAQILFDKKAIAHVSTKKGYWYNGEIIELSLEFMILKERRDGNTLIFFREIKDIDFFKPMPEDKK